jgi:hypothetical protein
MFAEDSEPWRFGVAMVSNLIRSAPNGTSFALLTFADGIVDRVGFSEGLQRLQEKVRELEARDWHRSKGPARKTALFDSVLAAVDALKPSKAGDAILLISDPGQDSSQHNRDELRDALLASGARLFFFHSLPKRAIREPMVQFSASGYAVYHLVWDTGGDFYSYPRPGKTEGAENILMREAEAEMRAKGPEILLPLAHLFMQEISGFYSMRITLPEPVDSVREWKLEAASPEGEKRYQLKVAYPRLLTPCQ